MAKLKITRTPFAIPGFEFAGLHCGIKDQKTKKDLALIYATQKDTTIAGLFTQNKICAGPVKLCQQNVKNGNGRLIVINSGIANASVGQQGLKDAQQTAHFAAKHLGLKTKEVFVCSTGKIGERVPVNKILQGVKTANLDKKNLWAVADAICTTDAFPKVALKKGKLNGKTFKMAVIAKGAGMINPNMATMLCYVLTDLKISPVVLKAMLKEAVDPTLNSTTVDGDTSTNDTILMMASGFVGNPGIKKNSKPYQTVLKILTDQLEDICTKITLDGEGATRCFRVHVTGAFNKGQAKTVARAIANSPLVKTAIFGGDPNWGRIICAAGYSGARVAEDKTVIKVGKQTLFFKGKVLKKNEGPAGRYLKRSPIVDLHIDLGVGRAKARIFASDLSYGYVKLNGEYRT